MLINQRHYAAPSAAAAPGAPLPAAPRLDRPAGAHANACASSSSEGISGLGRAPGFVLRRPRGWPHALQRLDLAALCREQAAHAHPASSLGGARGAWQAPHTLAAPWLSNVQASHVHPSSATATAPKSSRVVVVVATFSARSTPPAMRARLLAWPVRSMLLAASRSSSLARPRRSTAKHRRWIALRLLASSAITPPRRLYRTVHVHIGGHQRHPFFLPAFNFAQYRACPPGRLSASARLSAARSLSCRRCRSRMPLAPPKSPMAPSVAAKRKLVRVRPPLLTCGPAQRGDSRSSCLLLFDVCPPARPSALARRTTRNRS